MPSHPDMLAALAGDSINDSDGFGFVEPEIGRRAAQRFVLGTRDGRVVPTDAWHMVCSHLGLPVSVNELAAMAAAPPQINLVKVEG